MHLWLGVLFVVISAAGAWYLERLISRERTIEKLSPSPPKVRRLRPIAVTLVSTALCCAVAEAELSGRCVDSPEVQPSESGRYARAVYHGVLIVLLVMATTIDFDCYLIPDDITLTGLGIAVAAAIGMQELQIAHLWVDWAYAVPGINGPYIPAWYDAHRWLHAAAWSLTGALAGAGITQGVRWLSSRILGQEAMGFGDVTLMAMIGSFVGWQAVVLIFALAPVTGLVLAIAVRLATNRSYLPYGPCLAAATVIVLLTWSRLWLQTRMLFSDLVGVLLLAAVATAGLAVLLVGLRVYRRGSITPV